MSGVAPATSTTARGRCGPGGCRPPGPPASAASVDRRPARPSRPGSVRATAITGTPLSARAVAIPRPRPRLAPTTIVVVSEGCLLRSWSCLLACDACVLAAPSAGSASRIVVLATADSSSRRTSAKIAGRASSAIAPSTQSACWKPPVSAAGAAWPVWSSALVWLAATLEAIAIPIAPPSCWEVFSSPDASPAWCSATPASAAIEIGMNANAVPAPATTIGPAGCQEVTVDGNLGGPEHAGADQRHPDRHHDLGPAASDQRTARGRRARSTSSTRPATRRRSAARCSAAPAACTGCRRR